MYPLTGVGALIFCFYLIEYNLFPTTRYPGMMSG